MRYIGFDLETDGLLLEVTKVHMAILTDLETGDTYGYTDAPGAIMGATQAPSGSIQDALDILSDADLLVSFNGWNFDLPVIEKLYPQWDYAGYHLDLRIHGATIRPYDKLIAFDSKLVASGRMHPSMRGADSLRAWAVRAGEAQKGEYSGSWDTLNVDMWEYGLQDGPTTASVYHWMMQSKFRVPWETMWVEQEVARIIGRQQANGWRVDLKYLRELDAELAMERQKAKDTMVAAFGSWYQLDKPKVDGWVLRNPKGRYKWFRKSEINQDMLESDRYTHWPVKIPKRTAVRSGVCYTEGAPYTPIELHSFNPNSRADVYRGLNSRYGWEPKQRTPTGAPKISEETLSGLEWPEAKAAHRFFLLSKISSYTSSWLAKERNGRLYGFVNTNRANTRRMTHNEPNLANVPASGSLYGEECRHCFVADEGWVLVGADAEQLELRALANRLYPYDGGQYAKELTEGDAHTLHISVAAGIPRDSVTKPIRSGGKSVTYAWLYGAGDGKLADTYKGISGVPKRAGKAIRDGYEKGITGVDALLGKLRAMVKQRGYIRALDSGKLHSRSEHSILNLQLQSDGALIMKVGLVFADELAASRGLVEGQDFKWVGNIHDEIQVTAKPDCGDTIGQCLVDGLRMSGEYFKFPLPIDAKYMIGSSWAETH